MTDQKDKQALSDAELEAVVGGAGISSVTGTQAISDLNLNSMDIETAMLAVQQQRAGMLEDQLRQQLAGVQAKNDEIGKLNNEVGLLYTFFNQIPEEGSISVDEAKDALAALGSKYAESPLLDGNEDGFINREEVGALIGDLKSGIDSLSNSQQMDMLKLQNMSNKRNEAFEVMTNFINKMQDSRSSIIGNMR